ncbi:post-transcriptional regulator [Paenisporosarcina cavernae]|uniref:Post-transcriptional regulator n=1 Tax=Paenisporosarcina cavernae TaxID=2320858 RepID=A0A385YSC4_9BACL|nr:post-transcriptional regulator [Paenisporosarcina cavernae]AYC29725.1 hypothetical protein D3873_07400 [Paenisporosarcina cavernae]
MSSYEAEIYENVLPALESKKQEFHLYQYTTVSEKDIWNYLVKKKWRKKNLADMRLYEIVNDIMETSPAAYMTHTQIEEFRTANWFSELNKEELDVLLQSSKSQEDQEEENGKSI